MSEMKKMDWNGEPALAAVIIFEALAASSFSAPPTMSNRLPATSASAKQGRSLIDPFITIISASAVAGREQPQEWLPLRSSR